MHQSAEEGLFAQAGSQGAWKFATRNAVPSTAKALLAQARRHVTIKPCYPALLAIVVKYLLYQCSCLNMLAFKGSNI